MYEQKTDIVATVVQFQCRCKIIQERYDDSDCLFVRSNRVTRGEERKQHLKTSIFKPLVYVTLGHLIVLRMLTRMVLNNTFVLEGCPLGLHRL